MTYPGLLTFPSASLFPGGSVTPPTPGGYAQSTEVRIGDLVLTATDEFGVDWMASTLVGWEGSPSSTISLTQKPFSHGAWASPSRVLTPRIITIEGSVMAPTPVLLDQAEDQLNSAVTLDATTVTVTRDGDARLAIVYRQDVVLITRVSDYLFDFSVQMVAPDPRRFAVPAVATTRLPSAVGGLTVPFTVPFAITSVVNSGQAILNNPGNITGPVKLRIDGPCTGPVVTHVGSGLALVFASSLSLGVGEWVEVDMEAQTVLANGLVSRSSYVTQRGWSGFEPGDNIWAFTAATYNPAAQLTVTASPAWL